MVFLIQIDEVRSHTLDPAAEASPDLVSLYKKVVMRLTNSNFDLMEVKDPFLQTLWKRLELEALEGRVEEENEDEDDGEDPYDYTRNYFSNANTNKGFIAKE